MRFTRAAGLRFLPAGLALALLAAPAAAGKLAGAELQSFISGKRVYLAAPLGGEIPLTYRAGGVVDGSGEAAGLGKYMTPKDRGRWWVAGERLCQKWQQWYGGKTFCFTVTKLSGNKIKWVRDDGRSGVARLREISATAP
ncbi:hypothetical protein [Aestuariivirga sp.]|uniref:hypothetical protein n=1 Tax=Aestuariivirga sp. TaxID=2650926 RepID=UPI0025C40142|nr:hypothetical protein [Aestuariivirga sp.]